ncbi:hypothetical protein WQ54_17375 [Bacillus sp. SA1-12]|uniref:DUF4395 domain-containing protein n=1 Tax=Bacillus sp. SA1-12 TaxID=1455638 RepID=UPI0006270267|nr:DUF4395 domain-containing protein [Bacillus sp. SA1-12]KKI91007.1 hypothetical protein WQ54_17375 [Bacillus sp. SA1-12]
MNIPKPLVQTNQVFIVVTVLSALLLYKWLLLIPFIVGALTLITKRHLVILIGQKFLKKPFSQYVQEDRDQQLFNQWIATVCLGISLLSFYFDFELLGFIFSMMVVLAAGVALMGFCIGCTIRYRYLIWRHRRKQV